MDIATPHIDLTTLALRIAARPNRGAWSLVLVPSGSVAAVASALADEIPSLDGGEVFLCDAGAAPTALADAMKEHPDATVIVTGLENAGWGALDLARSRFEGAAEVVVVAPVDKGSSFVSDAPHLASWFGPNVWFVDIAEGDAEEERRREARLAELRARFQMTDAQAIEAAERGDLSSGPEAAEWLALLGRGDLLDQ